MLEREGFGDTGGGGGERGAEIGQVVVVLVVTHFVFAMISLFGRRENKVNPRERKWEKRRENEIERERQRDREFVSLTFLKVRRFFGFLVFDFDDDDDDHVRVCCSRALGERGLHGPIKWSFRECASWGVELGSWASLNCVYTFIMINFPK